MSVKIKVSYTEDAEAEAVVDCLRPMIGRFKVKKCAGTPPYKLLYFVSKNTGKPLQEKESLDTLPPSMV